MTNTRFFDVFEYNAPKNQWGCFLCNHPERASTFIAQEEPVIEGQLKEKKGGKWKIFKKWKSRYFTLSGKFDQFSKIILASGLQKVG